jgi:hypothetical protein
MSQPLEKLIANLRETDQSAALARVRAAVLSGVSSAPFRRGLPLGWRLGLAGSGLLLFLGAGSVSAFVSEPGEALYAVRSSAEDTWYSASSAVEVSFALMNE